MISSSDKCRQLVAGNYDVILSEPTTFKTVLTNFLERCERYENDLLLAQQEQRRREQEQEAQSENGAHDQSDPSLNSNSNNNNEKDAGGQEGLASPKGGYVNEFKMLKELSRLLKKDTSNYIDGLELYNRSKNRYGDIIPFNHTRVILSCNPNPHHHLRPNLGPHQQHQLPLEPGSDYINANYIRGPSGSPRAYIASQGPLPSTLNDFWRMIWECNVSVIVMACNEHELGRSKCEPYWPDQLEASQLYGNIQVTLMRVRQVNSDFLIRKFSVKYLVPDPSPPPPPPPPPPSRDQSAFIHHRQEQQQDQNIATSNSQTVHVRNTNHDTNSTASSESISGDSTATASSTTNTIPHFDLRGAPNQLQQHHQVLMEKSVVQFHISSWPDHGVPDTVQPILELVRLIREVQPFEETPILVHCSAGCGRTGTICCIDYVYGLMRLGKLDAGFDLFSIISEMRQQRMAMVQTLEQYILCHRAVAALFMQQLKLLGHHHRTSPDQQAVACCDTSDVAQTGGGSLNEDEDDEEEDSEDDDDDQDEPRRVDEVVDEDEEEVLGPVFI